MIESATWWKDGPEIETGEMRPEDIGTEVFFLPAAAHTEKSGSFTNTQRLLQWHHQAVEPAGDVRSDLWFTYHLGRRIRAKLAALHRRGGPAGARPDLGLPDDGRRRRIRTPTRCSPRSTAGARTAAAVVVHPAHRRRVHRVRLLDLLRRPGRRGQPGRPPQAVDGSRTGWPRSGAGPGRPTGGCSTTGPRPTPTAGRGASARRWSGGTRNSSGGPGTTCRTSSPTVRPPTGRPPGRPAWTRSPAPTRSSCRPTARRGCSPRRGWSTARCPRTTSRRNPRSATCSTASSTTRSGRSSGTGRTGTSRAADQPGSDVFPYVTTTYRLTEHHTAGGMSRFLPYLAELQPAFFCEVSPQLAAERALEHLGWATIITARNAIEARVLVTERIRPLQRAGPDPAPGRAALALGTERATRPATPPTSWPTWRWTRTCTSRRSRPWRATSAPGGGPRGPALRDLVRAYQERAGITDADRDGDVRWTSSRPTRAPARPRPASTRPRMPGTPTTRRGWGSSPTPRCASAARPARSPARNGTPCPRTGSC